MPPPLPDARCALTAPFHPCHRVALLGRFVFCGTFPGVAPGGRYRHRGPWSPDFPPPPVVSPQREFWRQRPSGRLAGGIRGIGGGRSRATSAASAGDWPAHGTLNRVAVARGPPARSASRRGPGGYEPASMAVFEIAVVAGRRCPQRAVCAFRAGHGLLPALRASGRLAEQGRRGARRALELASDPRPLPARAVQIGITAVGLIAGAYSGRDADEGRRSASSWQRGVPDGVAGWLSYIGVFAAITYVSVIVGELAPKNLGAALRRRTHRLRGCCRMMSAFASGCRAARCRCWLDASTQGGVPASCGQTPAERRARVTDEEIKSADRRGGICWCVPEAGERRADRSGALRLG